MNSPTAATTINLEELKLFHTIDRELYCILTFTLHHDPLLAIRIMAFWLWMESSRKYTNLIVFLHSLPLGIIKAIALETITCFHCLDDPSPFSISVNMIIGIPILRHLVNNDTFDIPYIVNNMDIILQSIQIISDNVCARVFDDIVSELLSQARGTTFHSDNSPSTPPSTVPTVVARVQERAIIRSDRHAGAYNNVITSTNEQTISPIVDVRMDTQHERTVFITFSKGYHVTETQVRDFIVRRFGEIIEDLIMQEVAREEDQPLFARMLVYSSDQVEMVLGGQNRVKFTINGKHVYARKYVKKNPKAFMASSSSSSHRRHSPSTSHVSEDASE